MYTPPLTQYMKTHAKEAYVQVYASQQSAAKQAFNVCSDLGTSLLGGLSKAQYPSIFLAADQFRIQFSTNYNLNLTIKATAHHTVPITGL